MEPQEIKVPLLPLLAALRAVMPLQSTVGYWPHLYGVLFRAEASRLTLVATDGWGLGKVDVALHLAVPERVEFMLATPAVNALVRAVVATRVRQPRKRRRARGPSTPVTPQVFTMRVVRKGRAVEIDTDVGRARLDIVDEKFPDFEKVIPKRDTVGRSVVGLSNEFVSRALGAARHAGEGAVLTIGASEVDAMRLDVESRVSGVLEAVYVLMPRRVDGAKRTAEAAE